MVIKFYYNYFTVLVFPNIVNARYYSDKNDLHSEFLQQSIIPFHFLRYPFLPQIIFWKMADISVGILCDANIFQLLPLISTSLFNNYLFYVIKNSKNYYTPANPKDIVPCQWNLVEEINYETRLAFRDLNSFIPHFVGPC